jgi:purine-cytosine permease-like protein
VGVGVLALLLALAFTMESYELFLLLIGSVFVPLFGAFAAEYLVRRRGRFGEEVLFARSGVRGMAFVPWAAGFVAFHWCSATGPTGWVDAVRTVLADWLSLPYPLLGGRVGASLPSFVVAFGLALALGGVRSRSSAAAAATRR